MKLFGVVVDPPRLDAFARVGVGPPAIGTSNEGDDGRRQRASDLGASEFLTKPVDFDALKAQLRQLSSAAD